MDGSRDGRAVEAIKAAGPGDRAALLSELRMGLSAENKRKTDRMRLAGRLRGSKYMEYLEGIQEPDTASTILVQIPAYRDSELLKTIQSARTQAANPDRIRFAVCLQDTEENRHILDGIPGLKYRFIPVEQASGSCRARWECQELYGGEDYVFITDSHMRFARFWDVVEIAQWKACGDPKAILSEYAEDYSAFADEPVGSDRFTESVKPYGRYVGASYFWHDSCTLCMWGSDAFRSDVPEPGAFTGCAHVFGPGQLNSVRFDPEMCFLGDEFVMAVRWWTHGFNIYHPAMRYVFHLNPQAKRAEQSAHRFRHDVPGPDGVSPREKEVARMEQLFGIADHGIDLGIYGLGAERGLDGYEELSGVSFGNRTFRVFSRCGPFDGSHTPEEMELFDWREHGFRRSLPVAKRETVDTVLPDGLLDRLGEACRGKGVLATDMIDRLIEGYVMGQAKDAVMKFRVDLAMRTHRLPGSPYLEWLSGVDGPDLSSRVSVEIPAYEDPELQRTIRSALAMAAVPDRIHFAVCLQGGTEGDAEFLDSLEHCRYVRYASEDAPGLCAARADCQDLLDGESYVLRIDSHMRFAWGWDVALIRQWQECGDPKAVLTEHPMDYTELFGEPADSDVFTKKAGLGVSILNAGYFSDASWRLRIRCLCVDKAARSPVRGMFTAGGMCFASAAANRDVPCDRDMYFVADECSMAVRYYTHGYNVYHPYVKCVYHLYDRAAVAEKNGQGKISRFAPAKRGPDGLTGHERETARLAELFGVSGSNKYGLGPGGKYGLGTERTLQEFETAAGVSFRDLSIRKFAYDGRFDVEHGPGDMAFVDWAVGRRKEKKEAVPGKPVELVLKKETVELLKGWQSVSGTPLDILVRWALEAGDMA